MSSKPGKKAMPIPAVAASVIKAPAEPKKVETTKAATTSMSLLGFILVALCFIVYGNTLNNGFVFDDNMVIKQNAYVNQGFGGIAEILKTPHLKGYANLPNDTYRPLSLAVYAIEFQVFGDNAAKWHFVNVLVFAACALLLFRVLNDLFQGKHVLAAFVASVIFVVHPIHTEVVANLKSLDELLCFFFAFLALRFFQKFSKVGSPIALSFGAISLFLSFLSKETVITFMAVVPLAFFVYQGSSRARASILSSVTVAVAAIFILIRTNVLSTYHANDITKVDMADNILVTATDFGSRMGTAFLVLGHYIRLLIVPYPLVSDYSFNTIPLTGLGNVLALSSMTVFFGIIVNGVVRFLKYKQDPWAFGILFFLISISLFSNFFMVFSSLMAERFLFFASVGFCLILGLVVEKWVFPQGYLPGLGVFTYKKALYTLLPVLLLFSALTIARNTDWATNTSLYEADLPKAPGNMKMNYNYANEKLAQSFDQQNPNRMADYAACIKYYKKAIAVSPTYQNALLGLGMAFYNFNAPDSSKYYLELALKAKPDYAMAMFYLANIHIQRKQYDSATRLMIAAVKCEPSWIMAQYNLGACYQYTNNNDSAIVAFKRVLAIDPSYNNYKAYEFIANDYKAIGNADSANKYEALMHQHNAGVNTK